PRSGWNRARAHRSPSCCASPRRRPWLIPSSSADRADRHGSAIAHALDSPPHAGRAAPAPLNPGTPLNAAAPRPDSSRGAPKPPLREHVAQSVRRYLRDLDGCEADDVYEIVLREMEIPLFVEVLNHCEGNQSRAAAMLGIHRATLRKKLKEYGLA